MPRTLQVASRVPLNNDPLGYPGRNVVTLKKISAAQAGQNLTIDFPIGNRKFGFQLFTQAVNYTGGVGQATKHLTGAGNDALTVTLTLSAGREPVSVAIVNGGGGYALNDTFQVIDATGTGAVFTVSAVAAGAVTAATYQANSATASPVEPEFLLQNPVINVGASTPYQVDAVYYSMRRQCMSKISPVVPLGMLPVDFADPFMDEYQENDETSWDTFGAGVMNMTAVINPNAVKPSVTGQEDFDWRRNSFVQNGQKHVFANPLKLSKQLIDLVNGTAEIGNLVIPGPIVRMFIVGNTTHGTISNLEFWADGQQRAAGSIAALFDRYRDYGYRFGEKLTYPEANIATSNALKAACNPFNYFDAAVLPVLDSRLSDALPVRNSHNLKITSSVAQKATLYLETLPGGFK